MIHRPPLVQTAFGLLSILQKQIYDIKQLFVHWLKQTEKGPPLGDFSVERIWLTNKPKRWLFQKGKDSQTHWFVFSREILNYLNMMT